VFFAIIYLFSFSSLLINNGIFWDDWHVHFMTDHEAIGLYNAISRPFHGLLFVGLRAIQPSHYFFNFLTFVCWWITGIYFYFILDRIKLFSKKEAFWIAALFIIFPQLYSRMCETILFFTIYLSVFTVTSYFYIFSSPTKPNYLKIPLLLAFFFSFDLEALMLFILIPLSLRYYSRNESSFPLKMNNIIRFCREEFTFILLPILYYLFMKVIVVFAPKEIPTNIFSLEHLKGVPELIFTSWREGYVRAIFPLVNQYPLLILIFILASIVLAPSFNSNQIKQSLKGIAFSLVFFLYSIAPYVLVGKDIGYYYIMDRNSILALFPLSLLTYYLVTLIFSFTKINLAKPLFFLLLLGLFVERNFYVYRSFLIASLKQDALVYYIKEIPAFKTGTTFLLKDSTWDYLPKETPLESSVAKGLLRSVFGTTTRCMTHLPLECENVSRGENTSLLHNMQNYRPTETQYEVVVTYGPISIRENQAFKWALYKIFREDVYQQSVKDFIQVKVNKI
jgi:hypothetical protein